MMTALRRNLFSNPAFMGIVRQSSTASAKNSHDSSSSKTQTVDQDDVALHSKLSADWWNGMQVLHAMNKLRVQFVRDGLANMGHKEKTPSLPLEGVQILDIGCGGGILSEALGRIGGRITGVDASKEMIQVAKDHVSLDPEVAKRVNYINSTIEEFSLDKSEAFDAVVASEVLEHVADKQLFLKHCVDTLKPGGSIFITTFNKTVLSYLGGIIAAEYVMKYIPLGTHSWEKFISPENTAKLLEEYGCKTKLVHGMIYNSFKGEWVWMNSTPVTYALHAVKSEKFSKK